MRILVTGVKGQLGHDIVRQADGRHDMTGIDIDELDIGDFGAVQTFVKSARPDLVINCAAYTNVDGCEANDTLAYKVNAAGPRNLAVACAGTGARLLQVSTDFVFDGMASAPYVEYDRANPLSAYGKSKWAGEELVRQILPRHYIVRTAWLYGLNGNNFVKTMLKLAQTNNRLTVVDDQRGTPTYSWDLAGEILRIVETDLYGTYHCTNEGDCTWNDFAREIFLQKGIDVEVAPITTQQLGRPAARPAYSVLRNLMLEISIGNRMRPWKDALAEYLKNLS